MFLSLNNIILRTKYWYFITMIDDKPVVELINIDFLITINDEWRNL